jgi:hypothetical protein
MDKKSYDEIFAIVCEECYNDPYYDPLENLDIDWDDTTTEHTDDPSGTSGKIYHPTGDKWPAVINSTNHTLSVVEISHTDTSIEWECLVSTADAVRLERFTISSPLPLPVVRCFAYASGDGWKDSPKGFLAVELKELGRDAFTGDSSASLSDLVDELCFITVQILEGRYHGAHRRVGVA